MGQARVLEPQTTEHAEFLESCGFRWCKKDQRWERNGGKPQEVIEKVLATHPHLRTEVKS